MMHLKLFLFYLYCCCYSWCCCSFCDGQEQEEVAEVSIDPNGRQERTTTTTTKPSSSFQTQQHGVDVSWPTHHRDSELLLQHRKEEYLRYIHGCSSQHDNGDGDEESSCLGYEQDRMDMNLNQPKRMENYTHAGFAKVPTPPRIQALLQNFWETNSMEASGLKEEVWDATNTYVNHWESPTHMLDIFQNNHNDENSIPSPMTHSQRWELVRGVQSVLEAWTKQPLVLTSMYGIRIYHENSILAPHVDRLPLVTSAIINVAQDVDEPWILEVIGHGDGGTAHNLTMQPGEMVLYESHSVIHGRPFPLKGRYYANLFVHFEPIGHTFRHAEKQRQLHASDGDDEDEDGYSSWSSSSATHAKAAYEKAFQMERLSALDGADRNARRTSSQLPHYVPEQKEQRWKQLFDFDPIPKVDPQPLHKDAAATMTPHNAAAAGNLDALKSMAATDRAVIFKSDHNGWRPLHEAARSGHVHVIEYLLKEGARVNERTNDGEGGSPLWWAEKNAEANREAIELLKKHGAISLQPKVLDDKNRNDEKKEKMQEG